MLLEKFTCFRFPLAKKQFKRNRNKNERSELIHKKYIAMRLYAVVKPTTKII